MPRRLPQGRSRRVDALPAPSEGVESKYDLRREDEAQRSLDSTRSQAERLLRDYRAELSNPELAQVENISQSGFQKVMGGLGALGEFISRPMELVQAGLRGAADLATGDMYDDPLFQGGLGVFSDIATGNREQLIERVGEDVIGEEGMLGFSDTFKSLGWDPDNAGWLNRAVRFVAATGGDIVTDPLTYITAGSSGLGSKVAVASVRSTLDDAVRVAAAPLWKSGRHLADDATRVVLREGTETALEKTIRNDILSSTDEIFRSKVDEISKVDDALKNNTDLMDNLWDDSIEEAIDGRVRKSAIDEAEGTITRTKDVLDDTGELVTMTEKSVLGQWQNDLVQTVRTRNFGSQDQPWLQYLDHSATKRQGSRVGEVFTSGGVRIGLPFSKTKQFQAIRGTRGGARKIRAPFVKGAERVAPNWMKKSRGLGDSFLKWTERRSPELLAARRGKYAQVAGVREMAEAVNRRFDFTNLQIQAWYGLGQLDKAVKAAGLPDDEAAELLSNFIPSLQRGATIIPEANRYPPEVIKAFDDAVRATNETFAGAYDALEQITELGHIANYVPIQFTDEFRTHVRDIADKWHALPDVVDGDIGQTAAELGVTTEELTLFLDVVDSLLDSTRRVRSFGSRREIRTRTLGRTLVSLGDDADTVMAPPEWASTVVSGMDQAKMSETLTRVADVISEKAKLPTKTGVAALESDPYKMIDSYFKDLQSLVYEKSLLWAASSNGTLVKQTVQRNVDKVLVELDPYYDYSAQLVRDLLDESAEGVELAARARPRTRIVEIGEGIKVELIDEFVGRRTIQKRISALQKAYRTADARVLSIRAERQQLVDRWVRELGMNEDMAWGLAMARSQRQVNQFREAALQEAAAMGDEIVDIILHTMERSGEDVDVLEQAVLMASEQRNWVTSQTRKAVQALRRSWQQRFGSKPRSDIVMSARNPNGIVNAEETNRRVAAILDEVNEQVEIVLQDRIAVQREMLEEQFANFRAIKNPTDAQFSRIYAQESKLRALEAIARGDDKVAGLRLEQTVALRAREVGDVRREAWHEWFRLGLADFAANKETQSYNKALNHWTGWQNDSYDILSEHIDDSFVLKAINRGRQLSQTHESEWKDATLRMYTGQVPDDYVKFRREAAFAQGREISDVDLGRQFAEPPSSASAWADEELDDLRRMLRADRELVANEANEAANSVTFAGTIAATETPLAGLARIVDDPEVAEALLFAEHSHGRSAWEQIQRTIRGVFGDDAELKVTSIGTDDLDLRIVFHEQRVKAKPPFTLKQIAKSFLGGEVTGEQLAVNGAQDAIQMAQIVQRTQPAIRNAARTAAERTRNVRSAKEAIDYLDKVTGALLDGIETGRFRKLHDIVYESHRGQVRKSRQWVNMERWVAAEDVARIDRALTASWVADQRMTPVGKKMLADNERLWTGALYKPIRQAELSLRKADAELAERARTAATEEAKEVAELAREFSSAVSGIRSYAQQADEFGVAVGRGTRLVGEEDVRSNALNKSFTELEGMVERTQRRLKGAAGSKRYNRLLELWQRGSQEQTTTRLTRNGFVTAEQVGLDGGALRGMEVDELVAELFTDLTDGYRAMFTPWGVQQVQESASKIYTWWKGAATVARPSFHFRNVMSGIANGMLAGVGPRHYAEVLQGVQAWRKGMRLARDGALSSFDEVFEMIPKNMRATFRAAWDQQVLQRGYVRSDLRGLDELNSLMAAPLKAGGQVMEDVEDVLRMAAFHRWYDPSKPASASLAREMTMAVHFDYAALTMMERRIKKIAPFFVWTRRNVPLQMRALVENPAYARFWQILQSNAAENFGGESDWPMSAYAGPWATPIGLTLRDDTPTWARLMFDPDLPVNNMIELPVWRDEPGALPFDFGKATSPVEWINWTTQLLGPQISGITELATRGEMPPKVAPTGINGVLRTIDDLGLWDFDQTPQGGILLPAWLDYVMHTGVPFFEEFRAGIGLTPADPRRRAREGFGEETPSIPERAQQAVFNTVGKGLLGVEWQTPTDTSSATFDAQEYLQGLLDRERQGIR